MPRISGSSQDQIRQVIPVREDGVSVGGPRQAALVKVAISGGELRITVGRQIDRVEGLVYKVKGKGSAIGDPIIPVIADVRVPGTILPPTGLTRNSSRSRR